MGIKSIWFKYFIISLMLITFFVALGITQIIVSAEPRLTWSDNPGAYEQHLIRRYNNPLFSKDRRVISQSMIDLARKRDINDYKNIENRLLKLSEEIAELPGHVNSKIIKKIRETIDNLIGDAMGVGGKANSIAKKTKKLRKALIKSWSKALSDHDDAKQLLVEAELYYQENVTKFNISFVAQLTRKDRPIPNNEVVPALLMEKPDTIAMIMESIGPNNRPAIQQGALSVLKTALDEGEAILNLDDITNKDRL